MVHQGAEDSRPPVLAPSLMAILGLLTFALGIGLLVAVFAWAHGVFQSIDTHLASVKPSPAVSTTARVLAHHSPAGTHSTVVARPGPPALGLVAASLALKLLGALVLGWIAAMIAARGASLLSAAVYQPKSER
jgi:hypothetical protein